MSNFKGTEGVWGVYYLNHVDPDIAFVSNQYERTGEVCLIGKSDRNIHDAHLISASKDLLSIVQDLHQYIEKHDALKNSNCFKKLNERSILAINKALPKNLR